MAQPSFSGLYSTECMIILTKLLEAHRRKFRNPDTSVIGFRDSSVSWDEFASTVEQLGLVRAAALSDGDLKLLRSDFANYDGKVNIERWKNLVDVAYQFDPAEKLSDLAMYIMGEHGYQTWDEVRQAFSNGTKPGVVTVEQIISVSRTIHCPIYDAYQSELAVQ